MKPHWQLSHRADQETRQIADRHYSRQKPGTPQFVPPGRCMVLKRKGCYWVTSFPFAQYVKHQWAGAWVFIDETKVRDKENFGRCYLMAGFAVEGRTKKDNLLTLRLPLTQALRLWAEYRFRINNLPAHPVRPVAEPKGQRNLYELR